MALVRWGLWLFPTGLALYLSCNRSALQTPRDEPTYVGDQVCASCHADIHTAYQKTWKAHSLLPVTPALERIEDFSAPPAYDPHRDFYYWARWESDSLYIYEARLRGRDTLYLRRERVDFTIGSGHQTRSYLLWRGGYLYEAPLTWYVAKKRWDLSPGYHDGQNSRFSREIQPSCLACHASGFRPVPNTYNRYTEVGGPLGCESCHGPASKHVQNPADPAYHWHRWPADRQMDVCSRCHLEGITVQKRPRFHPGDTLAQWAAIFLPEKADLGAFGIASHVERLKRSKCFQLGQASCLTCHHPHPTTPVPTYEARCQSCHTTGCKNPAHPTTGCVSCHMPRDTTIDIPHVRFTDHYIRVVRPDARRPIANPPRLLCATEENPDSALIGYAYLKWHTEGGEASALPQALSILTRHPHPAAFAQALYLTGRFQEALPWTEKALQSDSALLLFELKGYLLEATGRLDEALTWWENLAKKAPQHPDAHFRATVVGLQLGRLTPATAYERFQKILALQPFNPQYQYNAGLAAYQMGRPDLARKHWTTARHLDPDYEPPKKALSQLP